MKERSSLLWPQDKADSTIEKRSPPKKNLRWSSLNDDKPILRLHGTLFPPSIYQRLVSRGPSGHYRLARKVEVDRLLNGFGLY